jgi:hypothetical protein
MVVDLLGLLLHEKTQWRRGMRCAGGRFNKILVGLSMLPYNYFLSFLYFYFFPVTKRVTPLCDSSFVAKGWVAYKADHNLNNQSGENVTLPFEAKQEK